MSAWCDVAPTGQNQERLFSFRAVRTTRVEIHDENTSMARSSQKSACMGETCLHRRMEHTGGALGAHRRQRKNVGTKARLARHSRSGASCSYAVCIKTVGATHEAQAGNIHHERCASLSLDVFEGGDVGLVRDHQQLLVGEEGLDALEKGNLRTEQKKM